MGSIFSSILSTSLTLEIFIKMIVFSVVCGIIVAIASTVKEESSKSYFAALIILPAIVCTVIVMVNGSIGTGIAVAGAFSLVRFRSAPGKAKEIAGIFLSMTAGIACAAGYVGIAVLFTLIISAIILAFAFIPFKNQKMQDLRITCPESLNYDGAFDEILNKYTVSYKLNSVRTSDLGSLYKLEYKVILKNGITSKELIDDLRCRNGNLEIRLSETQSKAEEL